MNVRRLTTEGDISQMKLEKKEQKIRCQKIRMNNSLGM